MSGGQKSEDAAHMIYDLGNLLMTDTRTYDGINEDEQLVRANANFQGMLQALLALKSKGPVDYERPILEVKLPEKTLQFPRQKPIPKPKPMTKWEKFRVLKGLRPRKKRTRFVYDEITQKWVPRYGSKGIKQIQDDATGVIEDNTGIPLAERDPFDERKQDKKLRVEKQNLREMRNRLVASKTEKAKDDISEALKIAQRSTASMGRHDKKAAKHEPDAKPRKEKIDVSKFNVGDEKKRNMDILKMVGKRTESEASSRQKKEEVPAKMDRGKGRGKDKGKGKGKGKGTFQRKSRDNA